MNKSIPSQYYFSTMLVFLLSAMIYLYWLPIISQFLWVRSLDTAQLNLLLRVLPGCNQGVAVLHSHLEVQMGRIHFQAHLHCWKNLFPCGWFQNWGPWHTAIGWKLLSGLRYCPHFLPHICLPQGLPQHGHLHVKPTRRIPRTSLLTRQCLIQNDVITDLSSHHLAITSA